ncbi:MAG: T9SS type A sorting domain-containing protein [Bacteroidia bacterium]
MSGVSSSLQAQTLFKDLETGSNVSSNPQQFTHVNGTVYFITDPGVSRRHALWKTDGTVANTVMVKDSIITTNVSDRFMIRGVTGDTLYYTVNQNVQSDTTTELWMVTNSTSPVLVTTLTSRRLSGISNGEPRQYAIAGGKLYFQMYTDHGYELWVSDGTASGTQEVTDLFPGTTSGIANGGTNNVPMLAYKNKIYFQGITSFSSPTGLYSSDGTSAGTGVVKSGPGFNPQHFTVFNDTLFFQAKESNTGLWKTDGTTAGTVNVNEIGFNSDARIFKNNMYYSVGHSMYKSDGTTAGTVVLQDSVGVILGMNSTFFLSRYMRSLPTPPYYEYYFWRSDGTTAGTVRVADSIANAASFAVLNDKMYSATLGTALWESDGTEAGTKKLLSGTIPYPPFILNNTVFFSNFGSGTGYELWSYSTGSTGLDEAQNVRNEMSIYPNPGADHFQFKLEDASAADVSITIYNTSGAKVIAATGVNQLESINITSLANGIYFVNIHDGEKVYRSKLIIQH